jgi:aromatic ring-opening dioxygenase LigB subunit
LDNKTHFDFGRLIKEEIMKSQKRIAVIASGDMSHALTTQSPAGFNSDGQKFDDKIKELFMSKNLSGLAQIDKNMIKNAGECGFRSFLILAGIIQQTNFTYHELSYEAPFGVGYLVAEFEL